MNFYTAEKPCLSLIKEKMASLAQAGPVWTPMWHGFPLKASGTAQGPQGGGGGGEQLTGQTPHLATAQGNPETALGSHPLQCWRTSLTQET